MARHTVTASRVIPADEKLLYNIIADYHNGHPKIVPRKYFRSLIVEKGGFGEGTIIRFSMTILGRTETMRAIVAEPNPWRVLTETDLDNKGVKTTFTVNPLVPGEKSEVTIGTEFLLPSGFSGWLQKMMISILFPRIYRAELEQLESVAKQPVRRTT